MKLSPIEKASEAYTKLLLINRISNVFLKLIFNSFGLMFEQYSNITKDGLFLINLRFMDFSEKYTELDNFTFQFQTTRGGSLVFNVFNKEKIFDECYVRFTLTDHTEEHVSEFISICIKLGLQTFLDTIGMKDKVEVQLTTPEQENETATNSVKSGMFNGPITSFTKKIKTIVTAETLARYQVVFEDNTFYYIVAPTEVIWNFNPGDYAHHDGNGNLTFIDSNLIQ
jgi:hypothetical protein